MWCAVVCVCQGWSQTTEVFGVGARWLGAGGGGVAVVEDGTAASLNPAGLARIRRPIAALGYLAARPDFKDSPSVWWDTNRDGVVDEADAPLQVEADPANVSGIEIAAGRNVGGKFGLGFMLYLPTRRIIEFSMFEPAVPRWWMWDNRLQRFSLALGVGGEVVRGVSVGVSADVLARADVSVSMTLDAAASPAVSTMSTEPVVTDIVVDVHEIVLDLTPAVAPVVGVQLDFGRWTPALEGLVVGATWHGALGLPIGVELDLQANVTLEDVGDLAPYTSAVVAQSELALYDHYVPPRVVAGIAYRRSGTLTTYADLRWTDWRSMTVNVAHVDSLTITAPLIDLDDAVKDGNTLAVVFRRTVGFRMGAEVVLPRWEVGGRFDYVQVAGRGGAGFEPTPLVGQGPNSALLDANRSLYTLGAGVETWDPLSLVNGPVRIDLFGQLHKIGGGTLNRASDEPKAGSPVSGAGFPLVGTVVVAGGAWGFMY